MIGRRSATGVVVVGIAALLAVSSGAHAVVPPAHPSCVFPIGVTATDEQVNHMITYRKNVSCDGARTILRGLRGKRILIPMACHRDRILGGWHMRNIYLQWDGVQTHFSRGDVQINYMRWGNSSVACNHVPPFVPDEPDA